MHTTVGTDDVKAAKTVSFKNQVSGLDLSENKRVMVFWHDSTQRSGYRWLTAQDISAPGQEGTLFRANLPANVSEVVFAVADTSYYSMPVYNDSTTQFSFSTPRFSCFTHYIDFGESKNLLSVNTKTQAVDDENNPIPDLYILSDSNEALYVFEP
ncbi:MAG: hypothetical protein IJI50_09210 [Ruminococcus sp.]|nr:hypothetical protein [Ruminococcus sp.]